MEYQLKDVTNGMTSNSKHYRGICRKISQNKTFEYVNPILQYDWRWLPIVLVYQYCMEKFVGQYNSPLKATPYILEAPTQFDRQTCLIISVSSTK